MKRWGTGPESPHPLLCQERQRVERPHNSEAQNPALKVQRRREIPVTPNLSSSRHNYGVPQPGCGCSLCPSSASIPQLPAWVSGSSYAIRRIGVCTRAMRGSGGWTGGGSLLAGSKVRGGKVTLFLGCMENLTTLGSCSARSIIRAGLG